MQDFSRYPYIIQINDLEETARKAIKGGWSVSVVINGEYYDIDIDGSKLKEWKQYREGRLICGAMDYHSKNGKIITKTMAT